MIRTNKELAQLYRSVADFLDKKGDKCIYILKQRPVLETPPEQWTAMIMLHYVEDLFKESIKDVWSRGEIISVIDKVLNDNDFFLPELHNLYAQKDSKWEYNSANQ